MTRPSAAGLLLGLLVGERHKNQDHFRRGHLFRRGQEPAADGERILGGVRRGQDQKIMAVYRGGNPQIGEGDLIGGHGWGRAGEHETRGRRARGQAYHGLDLNGDRSARFLLGHGKAQEVGAFRERVALHVQIAVDKEHCL